uniref:AAA domain-containing protein n=1 Tax=Parastrongyloides trichosuri TaxID=131310 RepID=A0A0N5A1K9_PARTI
MRNSVHGRSYHNYQKNSDIDVNKRANKELEICINNFLGQLREHNGFIGEIEKLRVHFENLILEVNDIIDKHRLKFLKGRDCFTEKNRGSLIAIAIMTPKKFHEDVFTNFEKTIKFKFNPHCTVKQVESQSKKKLLSKEMLEYVLGETKFFSFITEPWIIFQSLLLGITGVPKAKEYKCKSQGFKNELDKYKLIMEDILPLQDNDQLKVYFANNAVVLPNTAEDEDFTEYDLCYIKEAAIEFYELPLPDYGGDYLYDCKMEYIGKDPSTQLMVDSFAKDGTKYRIFFLDRLYAQVLMDENMKNEISDVLEKNGFIELAVLFKCLKQPEPIWPLEFLEYEENSYPEPGFYNEPIIPENKVKFIEDVDNVKFLTILFEEKEKMANSGSLQKIYITTKYGREDEVCSTLSYLSLYIDDFLYVIDIKVIGHEEASKLLKRLLQSKDLAKIFISPIEYRILYGHYSPFGFFKNPNQVYFLSDIFASFHNPDDEENHFIKYSDRFIDIISGANEIYIPVTNGFNIIEMLGRLEDFPERKKIMRQINNALSRLIPLASFNATVKYCTGLVFDDELLKKTEWSRRPILVTQKKYIITEMCAFADCLKRLQDYASKHNLTKRFYFFKNRVFSPASQKEYISYYQ